MTISDIWIDMVHGEGLEPPKPKRLVYSQVELPLSQPCIVAEGEGVEPSC